MQKPSLVRVLRLRQDSDPKVPKSQIPKVPKSQNPKVSTSLLDNWRYQPRKPSRPSSARRSTAMTHSRSSLALTQNVAEDVDCLSSSDVDILSIGTTIGFDINKDDLDCPGHSRRQLYKTATMSSFEAFQDQEDDLYCQELSGHGGSSLLWGGSSSSPSFPPDSNTNRDVDYSKRKKTPLTYSSFSKGLRFGEREEESGEDGSVGSGCLPCSSSSEGMYDSSEDEAASRRIRAMSISDTNDNNSDDDDNDNNHSNNYNNKSVVTFVLRPPEEYTTDTESESESSSTPTTCSSPTSSSPSQPQGQNSLSVDGTFFRLERRASFDNGGFGMPDRIARGDMASGFVERNAMTQPGTPLDPGTPIARYPSDEDLLVDPEKVFNRIHSLLCAERVTQMTKTYNDIEAVTRLLEEKERDLELAARIGQTLLSKNKELSGRGDNLDEQLTHANDKISQLRHDLSMKDELLKFYCEDLQEQSPGQFSPSDATPPLNKLNVELLQRKVGTLEEENLHLRHESAQLRTDTDNYEEKEKKLVEDCLEQLAEVNSQVETFAQELRYKTDESSKQKEEMTHLLAQVADLHKRVRQLTIENMELCERLQLSQASQKQLSKDLSIQQDRYDELFEMLEEAQDELRGHRSRGNPKATRHLYASSHVPSHSGGMDSLASELENSMHQDEPSSPETQDKRARNWKVFETARAARKAVSKSSQDSSVRMSISTNSQNTSLTPSNINSDNDSFSDGYCADMDSMYGSSSELGRPGIPGSNDLESALRRLAMRRANDINERDFSIMTHQEPSRDEGFGTFRIGDTPDSVASPQSGYSYLGSSHGHSTSFKLHDKLQIVKPLEGSVTLRHWQRLAQPHLGGLFERREGVKVRGERKLDLEGEVYTLSDFEEDEDFVECPGRRMADSSTINTFTNSMVSQPDQQALPHSMSMGSMSMGGMSVGSLPPMAASTPRPQQPGINTMAKPRGPGSSNTSSTYTMSLGLAAILAGREGASTTRSLLRPIASCPVMPRESASATGGVPAENVAMGGGGGVNASDLESYPANTPGLFGKLINTGYSLLWNKPPVSSSSPSPVSSREVSPTADATARSKSPQKKPSAQDIMPKGGSAGVLGAIATFRKNGIL